MYSVGLPEHEKMAYNARVEALRRRFGQETDMSIALQELAKELADNARRLASRAYHSHDYTSMEKPLSTHFRPQYERIFNSSVRNEGVGRWRWLSIQ